MKQKQKKTNQSQKQKIDQRQKNREINKKKKQFILSVKFQTDFKEKVQNFPKILNETSINLNPR